MYVPPATGQLKTLARRALPWLLLVAGICYLYVRLWPSNFIDLGVYRLGGSALLHWQPLYDQQYFDAGLPFTYPPFAAFMFIPLALMPFGAAQFVWVVITLVLLFLVAHLIAGSLPGLAARKLPWTTTELAAGITGLGLFFEPVWATFSFGQVNILLMWLVLFDSIRMGRLAGALSGIATGIKIIPGIFVLFMIVTGRWRQTFIAAAAFFATVAVGFIFIPSQAWRYWTTLALDQGRVGGPEFAGNQSLNGLLLRVLGPNTSKIVWLASALAATAVGLWAARKLWPHTRLLALSAVGLIGLLDSPISWNHHWVWMVPLTACLFGLCARAHATGSHALSWGAGVIGILMAIVGVIYPIWWVPNSNHVEFALPFHEQLAANSYILLGVATLAIIAWAAASAPKLFANSGPPETNPLIR